MPTSTEEELAKLDSECAAISGQLTTKQVGQGLLGYFLIHYIIIRALMASSITYLPLS